MLSLAAVLVRKNEGPLRETTQKGRLLSHVSRTPSFGVYDLRRLRNKSKEPNTLLGR
jgi:hypothetical protein